MRTSLQRVVLLGCVILLGWGAGTARATDPNPLESAYWRFEEGVAGEYVPAGADTVTDSINANHLQRNDETTPPELEAPTYTADVPAAVVPQTGAPNTLALDFFHDPTGGDDLFPWEKNINNPIIEEGNGFSVEASFKFRFVGSEQGVDPFQIIICKESNLDMQAVTVLPIFTLRVLDTGYLQAILYDNGANERQVTTDWMVEVGRWYHAAVVNDGSTMEFYVDKTDGNGYVLEGTVEGLVGALWTGGEGVDDFDTAWRIGRGQYALNAADWSDATIDEVRLTNRALDPSEFLFVEGAAAPELRTTSIEQLVGDTIRVLFQNTGGNASSYGLAASDTPGGPFVDDPAVVITDLGGGTVQADVPAAGQPKRFYQGSATP